MSYPKIGSYVNSHGGGDPIWDPVRNDFNYVVLNALARFQYITLNVTPWCDNKKHIVNKIKALNPNIKIVGYSLFGTVFSRISVDEMWGQLWTGVNDVDAATGGKGFLYFSDGRTYLGGYDVNIGNQTMVDKWVEIWSSHCLNNDFDGIFMDYADPVIAWTSGTPPDDMDYVKGGYTSLQDEDNHRTANHIYFINKMRSLSNKPIIVHPNAIMPADFKLANWDGAFYEDWPNLTGTIDAGLAQILAAPLPYNTITVNTGQTYLSSAWLRDGRMGLASACMGACYFMYLTPGRSLAGEPNNSYLNWWMDEYSVKTTPILDAGTVDSTGANNGWLGEPIEAAQHLSTGLWKREFEKGIVFLNSTFNNITYTTSTRFQMIKGIQDPVTNNGKFTNTFVVKANDGLFALKAEQQKKKHPTHGQFADTSPRRIV